MNRIMQARLNRTFVIDRFTQNVKDPAKRDWPDRDHDRSAGCISGLAAFQTIGGIHRNRADPVVTQVFLNFEDQILLSLARHADCLIHFW